MKIETTYSIGDKVVINGCNRKILGMHLYLSERCATERYYLGNGEWITVKKGVDKREKG